MKYVIILQGDVMKRKIFITYITNAIISGFYILRGTGKIISAKNKSKLEVLQKITAHEFFDNFREIINYINKALDIAQNVMNAINLYVYGYPSLFVGLIAFTLSSIGVIFLTKKQTKTTVGYYVVMVYSYVLLGLLTLVYIIIAGMISYIKK